MEVCPAEPHVPRGGGLKPAYSVIHGDLSPPRPACQSTDGSLAIDHNAVVVGQGDAAGRRTGLPAQDRLGLQERAVGAARGALGAAGGRLDAPLGTVDARGRQLGAETAVLAATGGRPLDAGRRHLAPRGADRRVGSAGGRQRQWRSESDLAGSEDAASRSQAPADSDAAESDSEPERRQAWRSESHLAGGPAAASGTLSQRHRSQPCLLAARPDYSGVSSRVAAYIQRRRQQDRAARARRRRDSRSPELPPGDAAPGSPAETDPGSGGDCQTLAATLAAERAERRERERQLEQLQSQYEQLVAKYAEAETYIDRMRFHRPPGAERPSSGAPTSLFNVRDSWDASDGSGKITISPNETHTSQGPRFSRVSGVKSAILRRHSDEESSFRRFVQSKKELFPDGVGSKDSSFSDRGSVDLNDNVKNHIEEVHPYDLRSSPLSAAACADISGDSALPPDLSMTGWGPTSAPPALTRPGPRRQSPSVCSCGSERTAGRAAERGEGHGRESRGRGRDVAESQSRRGGRGSQSREDGRRSRSREMKESSSHNQAVMSRESTEKQSTNAGESGGLSPVERRLSRGSSLGEQQRARGLSPAHLEKLRDVSLERRHRSRDLGSPSLSESRDLSLEDDQMPVPSQLNSEASVSSVSSCDPFREEHQSSRDSSTEQQRPSRDHSPGQQRSSRDSDSCNFENSHPDFYSGLKELRNRTHDLSNSIASDSIPEHHAVSRDRRSKSRSRSRDEMSQGLHHRKSSPAKSYSSRISDRNDPSRSSERSLFCHSRSRPKASSHTESGHLLIASEEEPSSILRHRRRSSSDPGYGRRGIPPETTETVETTNPPEPPASRDRLQGVLSVLASQVQVIQAMVGQRGRSSRAARRCRSLSRRVSRSRVSVSPGRVVDRVEVVGVPVKRRSVKSGSGRFQLGEAYSRGGRPRSNTRRFRSVDWAGENGRGEDTNDRINVGDLKLPEQAIGKSQNYDAVSVSPTRRSAGRISDEPPPSNLFEPVRRRHPAGPVLNHAPADIPSSHSSGRRASNNTSITQQNSRPSAENGELAPSANLNRPNGGHEAPSPGTGCEDDGYGPPSGDHHRQGVPPLPLSGLESEQGDGTGSYCSLMSPRTVSPTLKVEQWRARLADVSPEPPPSPRPPEDDPSPVRPGPELRRLAGAVRGLQRQMSGFCRLVDHLRTPAAPGTPAAPCTPGSPGSSEASGARRRRYLREKRGLQLPLLPDKPAPPGPGTGLGQGRGQGRWDIRRPPARTASCERAVQTETAVQTTWRAAQTRYAVSRSDGELPSATASQYRDSGASAHWDRANLLAREVNLRSRCILEGVIRSTAC